MRKQPEALRLAEVLMNFSATQHNPDNAAGKAAAELRRLFLANANLLAALTELVEAGDNSVNPADGDDAAAMLRFGRANARARVAIATAAPSEAIWQDSTGHIRQGEDYLQDVSPAPQQIPGEPMEMGVDGEPCARTE